MGQGMLRQRTYGELGKPEEMTSGFYFIPHFGVAGPGCGLFTRDNSLYRGRYLQSPASPVGRLRDGAAAAFWPCRLQGCRVFCSKAA